MQEMQTTLVRLPADEVAARRFSEELWLPYNRTLESTVDSFALVDKGDETIVDAEVPFRLGRLESEGYRLWVAVSVENARGDDEIDIAAGDGELVGFVAASIDDAPSVFARPDRVILGDIYVRESHRGSGLARELVARVADYADRVGCPEITLDVDVDNERALAFYEQLGFEPLRHQMIVETDGL